MTPLTTRGPLAPLTQLVRRLVGSSVSREESGLAGSRLSDDDVAGGMWDVSHLGWMVEMPPEILMRFRRGRPDARYCYRPLWLRKRNGDRRRIDVPSPDLKALQRALLRNYLETLDVHPAAMGFRRGYSVADNARAHLGQAVIITADIRDFFGATAAHRVRTFFREQGWDLTATSVLTGITTLRGALPQGAPTSPALSNLVNVALDAELTTLVERSGGRYTRYGDDLAFSWPQDVDPREMETLTRRVLLSYDYHLNAEKGWRVWRPQRGERPRITGVVLGSDGRLHPSREIKREMRRLRRRRGDPEAAARLQGLKGFVGMLR